MGNHTSVRLFKALDLDHDGLLSRADLNQAAKRLAWAWREAPLLAALDFLTISKPITESELDAIISQIHRDPLGPYGNVLLRSSQVSEKNRSMIDRTMTKTRTDGFSSIRRKIEEIRDQPSFENFNGVLERSSGKEAAPNYQSLLETLEVANISSKNSALLIIDPQKSFTKGAWMRSIGTSGKTDVAPIREAFDNCAALLDRFYHRLDIMFTRCPFPADSYGWTDRLDGTLDRNQPYFIKPGNNVLFPPTNGFREWVRDCLNRNKKTLVMGGCTLNSCLRVSSIETAKEFKTQNLRVIVDLSLSGARARNYLPSAVYSGHSAVHSAVSQMLNEGVQVVRWVKFRSHRV